MKGKFLSSLLATCMLGACAFAFAACDEEPSPSESNKEPTKTELATAFKQAALKTWNKLGAGDPTALTAGKAVQSSRISACSTSVPNELQEVAESRLKNAKADAAATICYVYMVGAYYENDAFVVSNDAVYFDVEATHLTSSGTMDVELTLLPSVDMENNKLMLEMILDMGTYAAYYNVEIGYDFGGTNGVTSYRMIIVQGNDQYTGYTDQMMDENGKYYEVDDEDMSADYKTAANALRSAFQTKKANGQKLTGNLSDEFNTASVLGSKAYSSVMGTGGVSGGSGNSGGSSDTGGVSGGGTRGGVVEGGTSSEDIEDERTQLANDMESRWAEYQEDILAFEESDRQSFVNRYNDLRNNIDSADSLAALETYSEAFETLINDLENALAGLQE